MFRIPLICLCLVQICTPQMVMFLVTWLSFKYKKVIYVWREVINLINRVTQNWRRVRTQSQSNRKLVKKYWKLKISVCNFLLGFQLNNYNIPSCWFKRNPFPVVMLFDKFDKFEIFHNLIFKLHFGMLWIKTKK